MKNKPIDVKFINSTNPRSAFDVLRLEEFYKMKFIGHNPYELHRVNFFMIMICTAGTGSHKIDFKEYNLKAGTILTIRKDQIHQFSKGKKIKGFILLFKNEFLIAYLEKLEAQKSLQLFNELLGIPTLNIKKSTFESIKGIIERIRIEYNKIDEYSLGIIRSELHILITKLFRLKSNENEIVYNKKHLLEFIKFQNEVESRIFETNRVIDYADVMSVSSKTLNNIVKNVINKTAKEFIDEIHIKSIKRLLINTSLSIKEIAYHSGFEESTNFYKYFKRLEHSTPEQFRSNFK